MATDTVIGRSVLFGGQSAAGLMGDTWEWIFNTWVPFPVPGPSARAQHAMAFDPGSRRVVLFGGRDASGVLADTWIFDAGAITWTLLTTSGAPPARERHAMVFDPLRSEFVLFGGRSAAGTQLNDLWRFNPTTNVWAQVPPNPFNTPPSPREDHAMTYDPDLGLIFVDGGGSGGAAFPNQFTWDNINSLWQAVPIFPPLPQRSGHSLDFGPRHLLIIAGGAQGISR